MGFLYLPLILCKKCLKSLTHTTQDTWTSSNINKKCRTQTDVFKLLILHTTTEISFARQKMKMILIECCYIQKLQKFQSVEKLLSLLIENKLKKSNSFNHFFFKNVLFVEDSFVCYVLNFI